MGRAFVAVMSLVVLKVITYYLDVGMYGEYSNVYEFLALFSIIADFGLYTISVREMSKDEENIPKILGNILSLRMMIAAVVMTGVIVAGFMIPSHQGTQMPYAIMIATTASMLALVNGTMISVFQEKYKMQHAAIGQIFGKFIQVAYMLIAVFVLFSDNKGQGFYHLFWSGVIGNFAMMVYTVIMVRKYTPVRLRFDKVYMIYILKQAAPYGLALFFSNIYFRADAILIFNMKGRVEEGLYGVSSRLLEALSILPLYFMNAVLPTLTRHIKEKLDSYKKIIQYTFDFQLMLSLPFLVGGFILADSVIYLIAKPEFLSRVSEGFYGSDAALQIVLFSFVLISLNIIFNFTLIAIGKQAKLLWINLTCAIFNIIGNLIFIPMLGFRGSAYTTVASQFLVLIFVFFTAKKYLPFKLGFSRSVKILLSALIMGAVIYLLKAPVFSLVHYWNALILVPIGAVVYLGSLFVTKALTKDLIRQVLQK